MQNGLDNPQNLHESEVPLPLDTENDVKDERSAFHEKVFFSGLSCQTQERVPGTDSFPENISLANTITEGGALCSNYKIHPVITCDLIASPFTRCKL